MSGFRDRRSYRQPGDRTRAGERKRWPWTADCPTCGAIWLPTAMQSGTFPGSACDIGECICGPCENGYDCPRHGAGPGHNPEDLP